MKIKSYFCGSVADALVMARQELGPDAMLVSSRKSPPESRHLGEYEVVFAHVPTHEAPSLPEPSRPVDQRLPREVAGLKEQIDGMRRGLMEPAPPAADAACDPSHAYAQLVSSEIPPQLAREISGQAATRAARVAPRKAGPARQRPDSSGFQRALVEELESRFTVDPSLGNSEAGPQIVALVGPPGSGKTTTVVKLAVNYGLAARRPTLLLSMDTCRVGAAGQLQSYAAILGTASHVLETPAALARTIEENRGKDLIFIDTPGLGYGGLAQSASLAEFLSGRTDIVTHLVLPSSMKSADLTRMVDAFEIFRPQRLLFTKLDETGSAGPLFGEALRTGKPLSFFATGQRIPEDLEAASRRRLVELIVGGGCSRALAA